MNKEKNEFTLHVKTMHMKPKLNERTFTNRRQDNRIKTTEHNQLLSEQQE